MSMVSDKSDFFFQKATEYADLARSIVKKAEKKGADQAEVFLEWGRSSECQVRLNEPESVKQASSKGFGLRIFKNGRLGFVSSNDFSKNAVKSIVEQAAALADISGADEDMGLPEPEELEEKELEVFDNTALSLNTEEKLSLAREMEAAALDYDKRVNNSEGASFQDSCRGIIIANSKDISEQFYKSFYSIQCSPVVQQGEERRTNYWFSSATHFDNLEDRIDVGKRSAERAVRMLGARKIKTTKAPVILDPQVASGFIGTVMECVSGEARYKKKTCLWDKKDKRIATDAVTVLDDGVLKSGIGSLPFDGEGVPTGKRNIVENGFLKSFLYDSYSARKDGEKSTGNGLRSYRTLPSVQGTNFYLKSGSSTPEEIIKTVPNGLYITGMIGFGINLVNGDYSRGAEGIWIENGELTYPVHEITVSGNILDMLAGIGAVGNDLRLAGIASAPTILIKEMVISGK